MWLLGGGMKFYSMILVERPVLQKGMGFCFLWFYLKRSAPQTEWSLRCSDPSTWGSLKMPAIASLEDLRTAQKDLLEAKDLNELKAVFKKWRRIGWRNVCKIWLQERTPEQLKGEGG